MSSPWHTGGSANGFKLGVVNRIELHRAIVEASAEAFAKGANAVGLDGLAALDAKGRLVLMDRSQARRNNLTARLADERRTAKRYRVLAAEEEDEDLAKDYGADAREHTVEARSLEAEIVRLESGRDQVRLADHFEGEVEYLLAGLSSLLDPSGTVDRDVASALDKVLDGLELRELDDDRLEFSLHWLVPAGGTVVRFGPVTGTIARRGRILTPAERATIYGGGVERRARRELIHRLQEAGFPDNVARAVSICPFPELAQALLGQEPRWVDVSAEFDHLAFNEYLRTQYKVLTRWAKGVYCQTNRKRQFLADVVAAFGGAARVDQLRVVTRALGIKDTDLLPLTLPREKNGAPVWEPSVRRLGEWSPATTVEANWVESHMCGICRKPATAVIRVPEIPGSVLCRMCRRSPFVPEIEFPWRYVDLALPETLIDDGRLQEALNLKVGTIKKGRAAARAAQDQGDVLPATSR
jgi:hypothetical protein